MFFLRIDQLYDPIKTIWKPMGKCACRIVELIVELARNLVEIERQAGGAGEWATGAGVGSGGRVRVGRVGASQAL